MPTSAKPLTYTNRDCYGDLSKSALGRFVREGPHPKWNPGALALPVSSNPIAAPRIRRPAVPGSEPGQPIEFRPAVDSIQPAVFRPARELEPKSRPARELEPTPKIGSELNPKLTPNPNPNPNPNPIASAPPSEAIQSSTESAARQTFLAFIQLRRAEALVLASQCRILLRIHREQLFQKRGYRNLGDFAQEVLKVAPRTARRRLTLANVLLVHPLVEQTFLAGRLSICQAEVLAPV